jgi:hypothetical protein
MVVMVVVDEFVGVVVVPVVVVVAAASGHEHNKLAHVSLLGARPFRSHEFLNPHKRCKPRSFAATCLTSPRSMAAENFFKTKGKYHMYLLVSTDPKTLRLSKKVMGDLMQQGMRKSTVDLSGVKLISEGIMFPFTNPLCFRSAYAWCTRNFRPLLEQAGVERSRWEWRAHGDPVAEAEATNEVTNPGLASGSCGLEPASPRSQAVEVTDPGLYPPSVPLKFCRGLQSVERSCG